MSHAALTVDDCVMSDEPWGLLFSCAPLSSSLCLYSILPPATYVRAIGWKVCGHTCSHICKSRGSGLGMTSPIFRTQRWESKNFIICLFQTFNGICKHLIRIWTYIVSPKLSMHLKIVLISVQFDVLFHPSLLLVKHTSSRSHIMAVSSIFPTSLPVYAEVRTRVCNQFFIIAFFIHTKTPFSLPLLRWKTVVLHE